MQVGLQNAYLGCVKTVSYPKDTLFPAMNHSALRRSFRRHFHTDTGTFLNSWTKAVGAVPGLRDAGQRNASSIKDGARRDQATMAHEQSSRPVTDTSALTPNLPLTVPANTGSQYRAGGYAGGLPVPPTMMNGKIVTTPNPLPFSALADLQKTPQVQYVTTYDAFSDGLAPTDLTSVLSRGQSVMIADTTGSKPDIIIQPGQEVLSVLLANNLPINAPDGGASVRYSELYGELQRQTSAGTQIPDEARAIVRAKMEAEGWPAEVLADLFSPTPTARYTRQAVPMRGADQVESV
jgi:hypothetical protein